MTDTLKGTCLCEGVEYEVQDPQALGYCHCTRCQHWTGSSLAGVVVAKENFSFTKGEDLVKTYESHLAPRNFCSNCGSSIYDDLGAVYFVAAGLMSDLDMEPSFHQQVAYKANWHQIGDDAPQFAEMPPGEARRAASRAFPALSAAKSRLAAGRAAGRAASGGLLLSGRW
jgi:hypothetical protein